MKPSFTDWIRAIAKSSSFWATMFLAVTVSYTASRNIVTEILLFFALALFVRRLVLIRTRFHDISNLTEQTIGKAISSASNARTAAPKNITHVTSSR